MFKKKIVKDYVLFTEQETPKELSDIFEETFNREDESENIKNDNIDFENPYSLCFKDDEKKELRLGYFQELSTGGCECGGGCGDCGDSCETETKKLTLFYAELVVQKVENKETLIGFTQVPQNYGVLETLKQVLEDEDYKMVKISKEDIKKVWNEGKKKGLLELID